MSQEAAGLFAGSGPCQLGHRLTVAGPGALHLERSRSLGGGSGQEAQGQGRGLRTAAAAGREGLGHYPHRIAKAVEQADLEQRERGDLDTEVFLELGAQRVQKRRLEQQAGFLEEHRIRVEPEAGGTAVDLRKRLDRFHFQLSMNS